MTQVGIRKAGPFQALILLSCITLAVMAVLLIAPNIPMIIEHFKDTPNVQYIVPLMVTIPALCVSLLSPIAGWAGDKFGRRKILIPAMFLYSMFGMAPILLDDLKLVILTRIGVGIAEAFVMTLSTTMIGDLFEGKERDKWLAGQTAVASLSAVIFLVLGGYAGRLGWHGPFLIYAFPLFLMFMVIFFTWEGEGAKKNHAEVPHVFEVNPEAHNQFASASVIAKFPWKFMIMVCLITLFASLLFYLIQIQLSTGLDHLGVKDPGQIGLLTAIASLAVPIGTLVYWRASKKLNVKALLATEFLIMGVSYTFMSMQNDYHMFVAGAFVSQIGAGMVLPTLLTWAMSGLDFEVRGRGTGMWQSTFQFGQFACGVYLPFLVAKTGGVMQAFGFQGMVGIIAGIIALLIAIKSNKNPITN